MVTSCSGQCFVKQGSTTRGDFSSGSNFVTLYFSHFLSLLVLPTPQTVCVAVFGILSKSKLWLTRKPTL